MMHPTEFKLLVYITAIFLIGFYISTLQEFMPNIFAAGIVIMVGYVLVKFTNDLLK